LSSQILYAGAKDDEVGAVGQSLRVAIDSLLPKPTWNETLEIEI